jgi:hypothetical protein
LSLLVSGETRHSFSSRANVKVVHMPKKLGNRVAFFSARRGAPP